MSIERALYQLLKTANIPGNRIYALRAPQNSPNPFVIYQRTSSERWRHVNGATGMVQAVFQIDSYADQYHDARSIAQQIEEAIDGFTGTVAYGSATPQATIRIGGISCQNDLDLLDETDEPFLYRVSADYLITYEQS